MRCLQRVNQMTKEKQIVVQNIEDDLYCSQLNTSHCFMNLLLFVAVLSQISPALLRVLDAVCLCWLYLLFVVSCRYYGWHLKRIVEHASESEAEGNDSRSSQWTTGFMQLSGSAAENWIKTKLNAGNLLDQMFMEMELFTWKNIEIFCTREHNVYQNKTTESRKSGMWVFTFSLLSSGYFGNLFFPTVKASIEMFQISSLILLRLQSVSDRARRLKLGKTCSVSDLEITRFPEIRNQPETRIRKLDFKTFQKSFLDSLVQFHNPNSKTSWRYDKSNLSFQGGNNRFDFVLPVTRFFQLIF